MKRFIFRRLLVVLIAISSLTVLACQQVTAQELEGVLQEVDSISGEITVRLKDGGVITFNLQDVKIETLRRALGTAALEAGSTVILEVDKSKKVKALKVHAAEVEGVITSINVQTKSLSITSEDDEDLTLTVTEETKIELEDHEGGKAGFELLQVGQEIEAKYDVQTKSALKIELKEGNEAEDEESDEEQRDVEGVVVAVDFPAKTITIRSSNGVEAIYAVTAETELDLDGRATFQDIKVGMKVEAEFDRLSKELIELELED